MQIIAGVALGLLSWFLLRIVLMGVYTVDQNERAVKTSFGRAVRVPGAKTTLEDPISEALRPEERPRYTYPQVRVIPPGGPYFKMPWEKIHKVSIATMTVNMAMDPENPAANDNGTRLEAVTKDQLNTGLTGQIRYRVSEANYMPSSSASSVPLSTSWPTSSPSCASESPASKPKPNFPARPPSPPPRPRSPAAR